MAKNNLSDQEKFELIGRRIRQRRKATGLNQQEMAKLIPIDGGLLSKMEKGRISSRLEDLILRPYPIFVAERVVTNAADILDDLEPLLSGLDATVLEELLKLVAAKARIVTTQTVSPPKAEKAAEEFRRTITGAIADLRLRRSMETQAGRTLGAVQQLVPEPAVTPLSTEAQIDQAPASEEASVPSSFTPDSAQNTVSVMATPQTPHLTQEELIELVLRAENRQPELPQFGELWDAVSDDQRWPALAYRPRIEFILNRWNGAASLSELTDRYLEWALVETVSRRLGASPMPEEVSEHSTLLGWVALRCLPRGEAASGPIRTSLTDLEQEWHFVGTADWGWLKQMAQLGPLQIVVTDDHQCEFLSREEAEFLAGRYLAEHSFQRELLPVAKQFDLYPGVLAQAVRWLRFTGQEHKAGIVLGDLLGLLPRVIGGRWLVALARRFSLGVRLVERYLMAARILAACDAFSSPKLAPYIPEVEDTLLQCWEADWSDDSDRLASALAGIKSERFFDVLQAWHADPQPSRQKWEKTLRGLAILGSSAAVKLMAAVAELEPPYPSGLSGFVAIQQDGEFVDALTVPPGLALAGGEARQWTLGPKGEYSMAMHLAEKYLSATAEAELMEAIYHGDVDFYTQESVLIYLTDRGTLPALRVAAKIPTLEPAEAISRQQLEYLKARHADPERRRQLSEALERTVGEPLSPVEPIDPEKLTKAELNKLAAASMEFYRDIRLYARSQLRGCHSAAHAALMKVSPPWWSAVWSADLST